MEKWFAVAVIVKSGLLVVIGIALVIAEAIDQLWATQQNLVEYVTIFGEVVTQVIW